MAISALVAVLVYQGQKKREVARAKALAKRELIDTAKLIKLEIDSIEKSINNLNVKSLGLTERADYEVLLHAGPIYYQGIDWFKKRNLLVSQIDSDHLDKLNEFFSNAILLEEARLVCTEIFSKNRFYKIRATQFHASELLIRTAKKRNRTRCLDKRLERFKKLFIDPSYRKDFYPTSMADYYKSALEQCNNISNTPAYEALKKIAEQNIEITKTWHKRKNI